MILALTTWSLGGWICWCGIYHIDSGGANIGAGQYLILDTGVRYDVCMNTALWRLFVLYVWSDAC